MHAAADHVDGLDALSLGQDDEHAAQDRRGARMQQPPSLGHLRCPDEAEGCQGIDLHFRPRGTGSAVVDLPQLHQSPTSAF